MPQHGKGARNRAAADSDSGDDLFIEAKGKQKGGRRGSKTTTFIARPLAPSTSAQPSDSPEAKPTPQVRHTGAVTSSSRTQTGLQHASEPRAFSAAAPEAPPIKANLAADAAPPPTAGLWDAIPHECKLLVYAHLSKEDMACAARVNREFAEHVRELRAQFTVLNLPADSSPEEVRGMVAAFVGAKTLKLSRCAANAGDLERMAKQRVSDVLHAAAAGACERVTGVSGVRGTPVERVELKRCHALRDSHIAQLCSAFPALRSIALDESNGLTEAAALMLARYRRGRLPQESGAGPSAGCLAGIVDSMSLVDEDVPLASGPGLEGVSVAGCQGIGHAGVLSLLHTGASSCSLTLLDQSGTSAGVALNPQGVLQQLRAVNCSRLVRVVIQMPKDSALQGINLASCRSLRAAEISAGQLETLNLNDCPALAEVHFSCASLRVLKLGRCQALRSIDSPRGCSELGELDLTGCHSLTFAACQWLFASPALRDVSLRSLATWTVLHLEGEGVAPRLAVLDVSGCKALASLRVDSGALSTLRASSCRQLRVCADVKKGSCMQELTLRAQSMAALDLDRCVALERLTWPAILQPAAPGVHSPDQGVPQIQRLWICGRDKLPVRTRQLLARAAAETSIGY